jgi:SAM-dependent methyltransferase
MRVFDAMHQHLVLHRRARRLAELLSDFIPLQSTVLDVGSGDGQIASLLLGQRPDLAIQGIDLDVRKQTSIPVAQFDGKTLPFGDSSFDTVLLVDVLHHTTDGLALLREAVRVARTSLVLKDHIREGVCAGARLRFMDYVGNARHGVALPFNYWTGVQWREAEGVLGLTKIEERRKLDLYPWPADYIFGALLHFIARYQVPGHSSHC